MENDSTVYGDTWRQRPWHVADCEKGRDRFNRETRLKVDAPMSTG